MFWKRKKPICPHYCSTDVPVHECEKYDCPEIIVQYEECGDDLTDDEKAGC